MIQGLQKVVTKQILAIRLFGLQTAPSYLWSDETRTIGKHDGIFSWI